MNTMKMTILKENYHKNIQAGNINKFDDYFYLLL